MIKRLPVSRRFFRRLSTRVMLLWGIVLPLGIGAGFPAPVQAGSQPFETELAKGMHRFVLEEAQARARQLERLQQARHATTAGQQLYDVVSYQLALDLEPSTQTLQGTVTCTATLLGSLSSLELDLSALLGVSGVTVDGIAAISSRAGDLLTVDLGSTRAAGDTVEVAVSYGGDPSAGGAFHWDTYGGAPWIWTLSEPFYARSWWPCKDTPEDKAKQVDLEVTVPDGLVVGSNGNLLSETVMGGRRTFHWQESYPIVTYLVSLAIHPYAILQDSWEYAPGQTMPVVQYVLPDRVTEAQAGFAPTIPMLQAFSDAFGLYPFVEEKYGHAQFAWGGGQEHQTLCSLSYTRYTEYLLSHELSHQWWGDSVTCASFHHMWLNEGFATWSQMYWAELSQGISAYHASLSANAYFGPGTVYVQDDTNEGEIFNAGLVYFKGAWVLSMLRFVLGEADFFGSLRAWASQHAYESATTEDFETVCEQISGRDLGWFFQEWIYGELYPQYSYSWYPQVGPDSTRVQLTIRQTQPTAPFAMPVDVQVLTNSGSFRRRVWNDAQQQVYAITVPGQVQDVVLDPDDWVLDQSSGTRTDVIDRSPRVTRLFANHPNPFNPATTIPYELAEAGEVTLTIYDTAGRRVRVLASGLREQGRHEVVWNGRDGNGHRMASGTYYYQLAMERRVLSGTMTMVK